MLSALAELSIGWLNCPSVIGGKYVLRSLWPGGGQCDLRGGGEGGAGRAGSSAGGEERGRGFPA